MIIRDHLDIRGFIYKTKQLSTWRRHVKGLVVVVYVKILSISFNYFYIKKIVILIKLSKNSKICVESFNMMF